MFPDLALAISTRHPFATSAGAMAATIPSVNLAHLVASCIDVAQRAGAVIREVAAAGELHTKPLVSLPPWARTSRVYPKTHRRWRIAGRSS